MFLPPNYIIKKNMFEGDVGVCIIENNQSLDLDIKFDLKILKFFEDK